MAHCQMRFAVIASALVLLLGAAACTACASPTAAEANPQALGVEAYYLPSPKMSSFCAYLTALLHISDPICWLMSINPRLVASAFTASSK